MTVICYAASGKRTAPALCGAFAIGAGGGMVVPDAVDLGFAQASHFVFGSSAANFRRLGHLLKIDRRRASDAPMLPVIPWYYADGAYGFGRGSFFRITRGALQVDGFHGPEDSARWHSFGLELKPWRRRGSHVVIATQSDTWHQWASGMTAAAWGAHVAAQIRAYTDRRIVVCAFKGEYPFAEALQDAWAVVVHSSSAAIVAQIEGVPTFCLELCAASAFSTPFLEKIEEPLFFDMDVRMHAMWRLAAAQWTLEEIRDGIAWRALNATGAR